MINLFRCGLPIAILASLLLTACSSKPMQEDVITQKAVEQGKIPVTIMLRSTFSINAFEKAAEEKFPNLDIIQDGYYTASMTATQLEKRMEQDDMGDVIMTWPLEVGEKYWEDQLLDLSALPLTSKYHISKLNEISRDSKLYFLPGPAQIRGIVYNKTLFEEKGWEVPKDFDGFISLCQEIEKSGIRSLQLGLGNKDILNTAFVGFGYIESFSKPKDASSIANFNAGKGSFGDHFSPALDTFQKLIDTGVLQKNDLNLRYVHREKMFFTRECAMIEDSVLLTRTMPQKYDCTDEFGLMPFFSPGENGDWVSLFPVCYIGLNKHLAEKPNQAKYDLVMQLMEYISTPEGQTALAADTGAMYSSLENMPLHTDVPEIEDLRNSLEQGRSAVFPKLKNAQSALYTGLAGMINGEMSKADVIKLVDEENRNPPTEEPLEVLGNATKDFSMTETGNFITDVMRNESGCEIALFLDHGRDGMENNKGVTAKLYEGELTTADITRIMPNLSRGEKGELLKISMTGADLIKTLEHSISLDDNQSGWFYYFSGLCMEFDPTAQPGSRIRKITDANNKQIEPTREYTVAIMDTIVPEEFVITSEATGKKISDLLVEAITTSKSITPSGDGRFTIF